MTPGEAPGANPIGIMQGRLSPPAPHRLQAFPWASWEREFEHAEALGFDCIEWLFEAERYDENPIWTDAGVKRIRGLVETHAVAVRSVCADYFMPHPFFRVPAAELDASVGVLKRLIERAAAVGAEVVLVPVLEVSEIREPAEADRLAAALEQCLPVARARRIRLGLETELPAGDYAALVARFGDPHVGVYYDVGNAAARGYDPTRDIERLGPMLCGVHVKDRLHGGSSVLLGQGDADFRACFATLVASGYRRPLVLQTAFGDDYLGIARAHLAFVRNIWTAARRAVLKTENVPSGS